MKKSVFIFFLALLLSACSTKFGYNNIDWLIHWYVDDYVDLTRPQERLFDENIQRVMRWHRSQELRKYKSHLLDIKQDISAGSLDETRIYDHMNRGREHFERVRFEITPQIAEMAKGLSDEQVTRLFAALEKDNQDEEEDILKELEDGEQAALEDRIDDISDDLEDEIGRLSKQQKAIIASYAPNFKETGLMWIAYRRNIQDAARVLFQDRKQNPDFETELKAMMLDTDGYRSAEYRAAREHNRRTFLALLSEMIPTVSTKQKRKLTKRIDDIIEDLDDLMES